MRLRAVIVDDEPLARTALRAALQPEADIEVVAEAVDGPSAVETVKALLPDLLFLDVQMPEMDGFDVIEQLSGDHVPVVVFVTAFERYAVKAFEAHALDFLLKPFTQSRLRQALKRARSEISRLDQGATHSNLIALLDQRNAGASEARDSAGRIQLVTRFAVRHDNRTVLVRVADVDWIGALANYAILHVGPRSHVLRSTMAELEARLDSGKFVRIHRSTIVNIDRIAEIIPEGHSDYSVVLANGTVLNLSRHYRTRLTSALNQFRSGL